MSSGFSNPAVASPATNNRLCWQQPQQPDRRVIVAGASRLVVWAQPVEITMNRTACCWLLLITVCLKPSVLPAAEPQPEENTAPSSPSFSPESIRFFETKIRPVFVEHCYKCHGDGQHKGNFQLDGRAHLLAGGDSGPAIVPGRPDESLLLEAIRYEGYEMPPGQKLPDQVIADIEQWVKMGAPWPGSSGEEIVPVRKGMEITDEDRQWWAFQPVKRPAVPQRASFLEATSPIDAFILSRLEDEGLSPNGPASARVLIRRAWFDLIGYPPSREEFEYWKSRLEKGQSQGGPVNQAAWAELIDELLARPQYGERWGRHWLDVVRFAQTNGYERDREKTYAYRYRDYVVQAFNDDKPYDRFLLEQLAGDELPDADRDSKIATGFYRLGIWDDEPDDRMQAEFDNLDDILVTTSAAFFGLTVGCARCHDHKFDPLRQRDYYSLLAFFRNIKPYAYTHNAPEDSGLLPLCDEMQLQAALDKRQQRWNELDQKIAASMDETEKKRLERERQDASLPEIEWTLAVREHGQEVSPTHLLIRGNAQTPGDVVPPAFPEVLGGDVPEITPPERKRLFQTSGRRLAFAQWLIDPRHPLTSRVMVNRIWHYHFGRGIVPTTSDFGKTGVAPSHPELLDWLAAEFVEHGWSVKHLHRQIMLSQAYQRSSEQASDLAIEKDPGNRLLWRANLRRLDAEAIRDSILAISGSLNLEMGGRGFFPRMGAEVLAGGTVPGVGWETSSPSQRNRRSIYTFIKRSLLPPQLELFDYANTDFPLTERPETTVAPQALMQLNDPFIQRQARAFAERVREETSPDQQSQIRQAFEIALNRLPTDRELTIAEQFIVGQQQAYSKLQSRIAFRPAVPESLDRTFFGRLTPDEFIEGPEIGWTAVSGEWPGNSVDPRRGPALLWDGALLTDARIDATVTLGNAAELAGLLLKAVPEGRFVTGYELVLDSRNERISLVRHAGKPKELAHGPATIPTGIPLRVTFENQGSQLVATVTIGGIRTRLEAIDPQPLSRPGKFGMRSWGASITLDEPILKSAERQVDVARSIVDLESIRSAADTAKSTAWSEFDGQWELTSEGHVRPQVPGLGTKLVWNGSEFEDGTVNTAVKILGDRDAGLLVRVNQPGSGGDALIGYNINFLKHRLRLGKHENTWQELASVPCDFSSETFTPVRVDVDGARIRIYVDGSEEPLIDFTDSNPLPAGKIGFRTYGCPVEFQHLNVQSADFTGDVDFSEVRSMQEPKWFVSGMRPDQSDRQALEAFCLLLLNLNEMVYVE